MPLVHEGKKGTNSHQSTTAPIGVKLHDGRLSTSQGFIIAHGKLTLITQRDSPSGRESQNEPSCACSQSSPNCGVVRLLLFSEALNSATSPTSAPLALSSGGEVIS